jgi:hypothetical protein
MRAHQFPCRAWPEAQVTTGMPSLRLAAHPARDVIVCGGPERGVAAR